MIRAISRGDQNAALGKHIIFETSKANMHNVKLWVILSHGLPIFLSKGGVETVNGGEDQEKKSGQVERWRKLIWNEPGKLGNSATMRGAREIR